jgi:hypothetical protein
MTWLICRRRRRRSARNRKRRARRRQRRRRRNATRRSGFSVFRRRTLFVMKCTNVSFGKVKSTISETRGSREDQGEDEAPASEWSVGNWRRLPPMAQ